MESEDRRDRLEEIAHGLRFMADAPTVTLSALTGAGLRKLLPRLRPAVASKAAPAAADTLRYTLRAVQTAGTLALGLVGGKLWSQ